MTKLTQPGRCSDCGRFTLFHAKDCPTQPGAQMRDPIGQEENQRVKVKAMGGVTSVAVLTSPGFRAVDRDPYATRPVCQGRRLDEDEFRDLREQGQYVDDEIVAAGWAQLPWDDETDE